MCTSKLACVYVACVCTEYCMRVCCMVIYIYIYMMHTLQCYVRALYLLDYVVSARVGQYLNIIYICILAYLSMYS